MGRPSNDAKERALRQLSDKQLAFAVWFAQPVGMREPKTFDEVSEVLGVNRQTVWRWTKDPRILDAARFVVLQNAGEPGKVTQVLDMLHQVALDEKSVKYADLWLRAVGVMNSPTTSHDHSLWNQATEESLELLSDEALAALRAAKEAESVEEAAVAAAKAKLAVAEAKSEATKSDAKTG